MNYSINLLGTVFMDEIIDEFTDEFIELNLIIFCDRHTHRWTLWLLESPDFIDRETENYIIISSSEISFFFILNPTPF